MRWTFVPLGVAFAGCVSTGSGYGAASGSGKRPSAAGTSSTSGTGAGAVGSTGTGTAVGGSAAASGGSSGTCGSVSNCPAEGTVLPLTDCGDGGLVEIIANLVDFTQQEDLTCPVSITDFNNEQFSSVPDDCGYVRLCVAPGTQLSMSLNVNGYLPLLFATIDAQASGQIPNLPGVPLLTSGLLGLLVNGLPDYDPTAPIVLASIYPHNFQEAGAEPTGACATRGGYTLWLVDQDGGTVDAGLCYSSYTGTCLKETSAQGGFALFYNLDPSTGPVSVRADSAVDDDAGTVCPNLESSLPWQLTGFVYLQNQTISYLPYIVAAPPP